MQNSGIIQPDGYVKLAAKLFLCKFMRTLEVNTEPTDDISREHGEDYCHAAF